LNRFQVFPEYLEIVYAMDRKLDSPKRIAAATNRGNGMALDINQDAVIDTMPRDGSNLIDLDRYPLHLPQSDILQQVIAQARAALEIDGCARLSGFIRPEAHDALAAETTALSLLALHSSEEYTPYGTGPDESFPAGHPRRRAHRTTSGSVTRDLIPADGLIQQIYGNPHLIAFVAACLSADEVYKFADPMRGLIINSMDEGNVLGWHFDANEFIVSLMTRRADAGGMFEYCPGIRAPGHENFDDVQGVLDGKPDLVKRLDLRSRRTKIEATDRIPRPSDNRTLRTTSTDYVS